MNNAPIVYYFPRDKGDQDLKDRCKPGNGTSCSPFNGPHGLRGGSIMSPYKGVVFGKVTDYKWSKIRGESYIGVNTEWFNPVEKFKTERVKEVSKAREVVLADGKTYLVPVARLGSKDFGMPVIERLSDSGQVYSEPLPAYEKVIDLADNVFRAFTEDGFLDYTDDDVRNVCITCLELFFDLNKEEMFALGLFSNESYITILEALIDRPTLQQMVADEIAENEAMENKKPQKKTKD